MKRNYFAALLGFSLILSGCSAFPSASSTETPVSQTEATLIQLSDDQILINAQPADQTGAVQLSHDIVYYQAGQGADYGEGGAEDEHSAEEAQAHTVITIREPGTYRVSGKLSAGQIAIDLGEDAKDDPNAVVNLILDQAEITCTVAPAIIVYNAYECAGEEALSTVDTRTAGFNLIVADGTENYVSGAYVARIYKEGTTKKLHKYDAAIESKVSLNLSGETAGTGILRVEASNEGIETSMHMTINSGSWIIHSADDSLNANEDGISVITINGGTVRCDAGAGQEGDGIDSNGWIVINGGTVIAAANPVSMDSGLDSDNGILIHGGTVLASGNMFDDVDSASTQNVMVFSFAQTQNAGGKLVLSDNAGQPVAGLAAANDYTVLVYSSPQLSEQDYTLAQAETVEGEDLGGLITPVTSAVGLTELSYTKTALSRGMGMRPQGGEFPEDEGRKPGQRQEGEGPQGEMPQGEFPQGESPADEADREAGPPADQEGPMGGKPEDGRGPQNHADDSSGELNATFTVFSTIAIFSQIQALKEE